MTISMARNSLERSKIFITSSTEDNSMFGKIHFRFNNNEKKMEQQESSQQQQQLPPRCATPTLEQQQPPRCETPSRVQQHKRIYEASASQMDGRAEINSGATQTIPRVSWFPGVNWFSRVFETIHSKLGLIGGLYAIWSLVNMWQKSQTKPRYHLVEVEN